MENWCLKTAGLDSGTHLIMDDFFYVEFPWFGTGISILVRGWCFFPSGPAEAAVMVSERSVRNGSGIDARADASAYGTGMAHVLCLTPGL